MTNRRRTAASLLTLFALGGCLVGCASSDGRVGGFRMNPTPKMDTLNETHDDIDNEIAVKFDTELRMLNRDLGWALFLDRPSRLNPIQIPH
jgi:hypothetical protein